MKDNTESLGLIVKNYEEVRKEADTIKYRAMVKAREEFNKVVDPHLKLIEELQDRFEGFAQLDAETTRCCPFTHHGQWMPHHNLKLTPEGIKLSWDINDDYIDYIDYISHFVSWSTLLQMEADDEASYTQGG